MSVRHSHSPVSRSNAPPAMFSHPPTQSPAAPPGTGAADERARHVRFSAKPAGTTKGTHR